MKVPTISIICTLFIMYSCHQEEHFNAADSYIEKVEISNQVHKDHIGQITFMADFVGYSDYQEKDMIERFILPVNAEGIDLNMRAFLPNSLSNHIKVLSPESSIDELVSKGNYQFTFLVDDKVIYTENLNAGAGTPWTKNQYASLSIPLISSTNADQWGRFLWARFMMRNGGREALLDGSHLLTIEMRPYIKLDEIKVGELMAKGSLEIIGGKSPEVDPDIVKPQKIMEHPDFAVSEKPLDKVEIGRLKGKIVQDYFKDITSMIILNEGKIQLEEYFGGSNRSTLHDTRSVGKSVTGALVGLAIDKRYLEDEYVNIGSIYNENELGNRAEQKKTILLHQLLTMSSPIDGSDMDEQSLGNENNYQSTGNWMETVRSLGVDPIKQNKPKWDYFTGGTMLLSDILEKSIPSGLEDFAEKHLFEPLKFEEYEWQFTPQGTPYGGGGLRMTALDLAKFGSLYSNKGKWKDQQVISESWINKSFTPHVSLPREVGGDYGYLFYSTDLNVDERTYKAWFAAGNGGNVIYIFQDLPLVMVITATAYNTMEGATQARKMIEHYLLPACLRD